jgi:hypothetical protein
MGAALCAGLVLGLAACGDDDEVAAQSGSTGGNSDTDSDDTVQAAGTECLVGTWVADNKHFGAMLSGAAGEAGGSATVSDPTGEVLVTFSAGGQYDVTYKAWTFEMSQQGMKVEVVRKGTDKGTYQAKDDGHITTSETDMGSVVSMTSPGGTHSTSSEPSSTTGTFTCQGDILEVTAEGATSIMNRQ